MAISGSAVYLSTFLLEKNRWNGKGPSLLVSDWMEPIGEAGFAGLDLWMNHLRFASRSEWELIKEKATDSDLELAFISSIIPSDNSDKSQKLRDAILEACDYFRPQQLKFSLSEDVRDTEETRLAALEAIKIWSQDVHRDIGMLFDPGPDKQAASKLVQTRSILAGGRFRSMLQPFLIPVAEFEGALSEASDFLTCLSMQAKKNKDWILLEENRVDHLKTLTVARDHGFKGMWVLESTKGMGRPGEDIDDLFDNAEKDLNYLIEALRRPVKAGATKAIGNKANQKNRDSH
jgi:hypothetical protein